MKTHDAAHDLEVRAAAALKAALAEISTIKVREIRRGASDTGHGLTAYLDVLGSRHSLACEVQSDAEPHQLRAAFAEWRSGAAHRASDAMQVIIAPYLSPEAQALCKEHNTGFIDLEGNARLALGEVFIVKRTLPHTPASLPLKAESSGKASAWRRPSARAGHAQKSAARQPLAC